MAKTGLNEVTTAQTFQTWLDRTNELVDIIATDTLTASVLGDTTTGNATLVGSFTANTVTAVDVMRTDVLSPKSGSTSISLSSPVTINSSSQTTQTLISTSGPRSLYSSGSLIWSAGFENTTSNRFIINTGTGAVKLALSSDGNLSIAGSMSAAGSITAAGGLVGDVTGNATTASALSTARTIVLGGDLVGSASFDGSSNITITASVNDDSHNHVINNVDGLQTALNSKAELAGSSSQNFSAGVLNATTVDLGSWTVTESGDVLYFAFGGISKMKLDSSGNLTVTGNVTGFGAV